MRRTALALGVGCLALACDVTAPDRRDVYGFRLAPDSLVFHWPAARLPVRYYAAALGALPDYVRAGLAAWEGQFLYGEFAGVVVGDSTAADVWITLEGGVPAAAPLTAAPPVDACTGQTSITVTANQLANPVLVRIRWFPGFTGADVANCLARVTAHEIGHTLGLFQHSSRPEDLMFGVPSARAPSARDRATVETLYHTKPDLEPAPGPR